MLLFATGWKFFAGALVWTVIIGFFVFLIECILLLSGAVNFFYDDRPRD